MHRILPSCLIASIYCSLASAGTIVHPLSLPEPRIEIIAQGHRVILDQAMSTGAVGDPILPVWGLNLLLPPGEEAVSVTVEPGNPVSLGFGYHIPPMQKDYPLSFTGKTEPDLPNTAVYENNAAYPQNLAPHFRTDFYRGYSIAAIALNPVTYNPVSGEIVYYPHLTVTVHSELSSRAAKAYTSMLKKSPSTAAKISSQVDNPSDLALYGAVDLGTDEPYYDILLVTSAGLAEYWDDYIAWKTRCGHYVALETVQDIAAAYPGVDSPEKVRNCVLDYYENFDLSYIFLGGDEEVCPLRELWASGTGVPGDIYFAGLDGNWDTDGDGHWGEPNEADLRMEIGVSRAAVDSRSEIENFVNKQIMYQMQPVVDEVETGLMVGEDLGWDVWGWEYKEEIRTGSSTWGFVTAPFPPNFEVAVLYDRYGYSFSAMNELRPSMNEGPIYLNHMGHAGYDYMLRFYDNQITTVNFTNNGINHNFYLIYSQGCLCGAFDQNSPDCITEIFSTLAAGPVCMITNSRYGYGNVSTTQGSSQYYDKQFFDAIWGENITIASNTQEDAKEDCIPYIDYQMNRYVYYESNIFCEPMLDLWTAQPQTISASYPAEIFLDTDTVQVTVPGLDSARVCLSKNGSIHGLGFTDAAGVCHLAITEPLMSLGQADLYITAHNCLPHQGTVQIIPCAGPYVVFDSLTVDDISGNNNCVWDYGETIFLDMTLQNIGVSNALGVSASIAADDSLAVIIDSSAFFGDIAASAGITVDNAYTVMIPGSIENGWIVPFILTASCGTSSWNSAFSLTVNAPYITYQTMTIDDASGNANGFLDPGETAVIDITLLNEGGCFTTLLQTGLTVDNTYITITPISASSGAVLPGEEAIISYTLTAAPDCPQEQTVEFILGFTDAIGYAGTDGFSTIVGDVVFLPAGPDEYGYRAYDPGDLPELPVYQWVEISADSGGPGTAILFTEDDQLFHFALPFDFTYYGEVYDSLTVSSNGYLAMGIINHDDHTDSNIPNSDGPEAMIAAYWEDLSPQRHTSGKVWQWFDAVNHLYIVEYNHIEQFEPIGSFETFQVILYDPAIYPTIAGDGRIKMQYKRMSPAAQNEGTIGIENPAETTGIEYLHAGTLNYYSLPLSAGLCILYTMETDIPPLQITLTPEIPSIVIPAQGGNFSYTAELSNTGFLPIFFDIWVMAALPDSTLLGPIFTRFNTCLPGSAVSSRNLNQAVPGSAPAGLYTYTMLGGNYTTGTVYAQDSFEFTKSAAGGFSPGSGGWLLTGWEEDNPIVVTALPEKFELRQNYPNPFNPVYHKLPPAASR